MGLFLTLASPGMAITALKKISEDYSNRQKFKRDWSEGVIEENMLIRGVVDRNGAYRPFTFRKLIEVEDSKNEFTKQPRKNLIGRQVVFSRAAYDQPPHTPADRQDVIYPRFVDCVGSEHFVLNYIRKKYYNISNVKSIYNYTVLMFSIYSMYSVLRKLF